MANIHTHVIGVVYSSYVPRVSHLSAHYYCMVGFYMAAHDQCLSVDANLDMLSVTSYKWWCVAY